MLSFGVFQLCIFSFLFLVCPYWHPQYFSSAYFTLLSSSVYIGIWGVSVLYSLLFFPRLFILASTVLHFCIVYFPFLVPAFWHVHILWAGVFEFCILYFGFLVSAYWHLQYFSSVYFTLLSSCLDIDVCSISVLCILLCFPRTYILTSAVFQFCMFYFAFLVSAYWHRQYFSSVFYFACLVSAYWQLQCFSSVFYFTFLVASYWHLQYFSSVYFTLLSSSLHIGTCSISVLYFSLSFPRLCMLASAAFQFFIFYCAFLVSTYCHLQYLSSVCFSLYSSSRHIDIGNISVLYFTLFDSSLHIDSCSVSVLYFTLLSSSLHIDICSISVLFILLCFLRLCILASAVFQFCIFHLAFLVSVC